MAGIFTNGALEQLRSQGFSVLYFPYGTVIEAFRGVGIDANFEESTTDDEVEAKIRAWDALPNSQRTIAAKRLLASNAEAVQRFMRELESIVTRQIESVRIIPLHGSSVEKTSIEEAINFIEHYSEDSNPQPFVRYEVKVLYNNGNEVQGQFRDKDSAIQFLRNYVPPKL